MVVRNGMRQECIRSLIELRVVAPPNKAGNGRQSANFLKSRYFAAAEADVRQLAELMLMEEIRMPFIHHSYQSYKRRILIAAAIFSALTSPSFLFFHEGSAQARLFDLISIIGFGILTLGWCYYDSLERNSPLGSGFRVLIALFGILALFIYLIKSRGLRRGASSIGIALLVIAGAILIGGISTAVVGAILGVE